MFLTGYEHDAYAERVKTANPRGYLVKPIAADQLKPMIEIALRSHSLERRLAESEELHRTILSSISDAVFLTDDKGGLTWVGPNVDVIFKYSQDEVQKMCNIAHLMGHGFLDKVSFDAKGETHNLQHTISDKEGVEHVLLVQGKRVSIGRSTILYSCRDITAMIQSERFRAMFETTTDYIFILNRQWQYISINNAMEELLGRSASEILGKTAYEIYHRELADRIHRSDLGVMSGEVVEEEISLTVQGVSRTFLSTKTPLKDSRGQIIGISSISRDITGRKKRLTHDIAKGHPIEAFPYISPAMGLVLKSAEMGAQTDSIVLLTGESGTGKDYLAQFIHGKSKRASGPYFAINCAALPLDLAESELFGHEAGAFTGTKGRKRGLLELAEGGTILLNEIGEMSLQLQAKLLSFLDTRTFTRVGGEKPIRVDARLVAATNRDLDKEIAEGRFRQDLFYRLSVISIRIPPLRDRLEGIPALVNRLIAQLAHEMNLPIVPGIDEKCMAVLQQYDWPGNIRELRNVLERALMLSCGGPIRPASLVLPKREEHRPDGNFFIPPGKSLTDIVGDFKTRVVEDTLQRCGGNKSKAARMLGVTRLTVINCLKERR